MSLWHQGETKFRSRHLRDSAVPEPAVEVQSVPEHSQCSRTCSNDPGVVYYVEAPPRSCLNEKTDCQLHTEPLSSHSWPASKDLNCQHSLQVCSLPRWQECLSWNRATAAKRQAGLSAAVLDLQVRIPFDLWLKCPWARHPTSHCSRDCNQTTSTATYSDLT